MVLGFIMWNILIFYVGRSIQLTSNGPTEYPTDSLNSPSSLYPLGGAKPLPRVHHTTVFVDGFVIIYAGYFTDGSWMDDISLFDTKSKAWSGIITRKECCNSNHDIIETLGLEVGNLDIPRSRIGFQGDIPMARAEHAATPALGFMYIFGGNSKFGLLNDLWKFDPINIRWKSIADTSGPIPSRRAGHNLLSYNDKIYLFGGRGQGQLFDGMTMPMAISFNDVWVYDPMSNIWNVLEQQEQGVKPSGRQFAAATITSHRIWIFGGVDADSGVIFNDIWTFNLNSNIWEQISKNSGSMQGFAPPPLYLSHLIPIPTQNNENDPHNAHTQRLLIYGGIGSGGSCGGTGDRGKPLQCEPLHTALGQLFLFEVSLGSWSSPHLTHDHSIADNDFILHHFWKYARLTSILSSSEGNGSSGSGNGYGYGYGDIILDRGRLRKLYAYESVAYSIETGLLYEFGGMSSSSSLSLSYQPMDKDPLSSSSSSSSSQQQTARGLYTPSPLSLDAGGDLGSPLWDLLTAEHLREFVDIPTNDNAWTYSAGFSPLQPPAAPAVDKRNESHVRFLDHFHIYKVSLSDMTLLLSI
eukprot:gene7954-16283_t